MSELVIKISGDLKDYEAALGEAEEKTKGLEGSLASIAKISGVAFAALTAEIFVAAKAFGESQAASNRLTNALANQGIYSTALEESYKAQTKELEKLTGIDDDALVKSQALLQSMIGQQKITFSLTKAIADLSVGKEMDLETTTRLVGQGIAGHTAGLQRLGIVVDDHLSKEERTAKIIELVNNRFKDQATVANQGIGSIKGLQSAFGDFQEEIGSRFEPAISFVIKEMTGFFQYLSENKEIMNLTVSLITAGVVVSALGLSIGLAGSAFLALRAALVAAGIAVDAMTLGVRALAGATGIGLLVLVGTEIYLHWSRIWPALQGIFQIFVENISNLAEAFGKIFKGAFSLNIDLIKQGLEEAKNAVMNGYDEFINMEVEHQETKKTVRNAARTEEQELDAINQQLMLEQNREFNNIILADNAAYQALNDQQKMVFRNQQLSKLRENLLTEKSISVAYATQEVADDVKRRNQFLVDEQKFGTAYATINSVMHSEIYQGSKKAFGEMSQMVNSQNETLKTLGKAASIANIVIKTAESAMNIYAGFSVIPFIGPVLGGIGAAAAVAFGAEQIGKVVGAADGGLMTGGIPNVDSIPAMLQQGELVVPKKNFEEVVSAVNTSRDGDSSTGSSAEQAVHVVLSLKDDLIDFVEAKLVERQRLNISLQGMT